MKDDLRNSLLEDVFLNEKLETEVLKDVSLFETPLEKAIYFYIKLCKILTYDEEYFSVSQNEEYEIVQKHKRLSNISTITPSNNKVVCYEFVLIYAKLLSKIGIQVKINDDPNQDYGNSHTYLSFVCGKFLIDSDAVMNIFYNDMMQAKLNQKLRGLLCTNEDIETKKEFLKIVTKVYNLIFKLENKNTCSYRQVEAMETSDDIFEEYHIRKGSYLDLDQRVSLLVSKVNKSQLVGIDSLSYLLQLRKVLFTKKECEDNINIIVIRNNTDSLGIRASAILVLNVEDLANDFYDNEYYLYNPNEPLLSLDCITLRGKFITGEYQYVNEKSIRIPSFVVENKPSNKKI